MASFTYAIPEQAPLIRAQATSSTLSTLPLHQRISMLPFSTTDSNASTSFSDFVWQNKSTSDFQELRRQALVYNHLCGAEIFEDKAKLALLLAESTVSENALESYVFPTVVSFSKWCKTTSDKWNNKLWVAKTPMGNSGSGVWMLSSHNCAKVTTEILNNMSKYSDSRHAVVVQEYVMNPMLWRGRKLQFRIYAVIKGDLSVWLYRHGMLQFCNKEYKEYLNNDNDVNKVEDDEIHITNVCRNVHNSTLFVREKPVDLVSRYPQVYASISKSLCDLVRQSSSFLKHQRSQHHFEFIGCDYIVDNETGAAKLIECNCPPNNTGSDPIGTIEDFHSDLWEDIMQAFVITPIVTQKTCETRKERMKDVNNVKECECGMFENILSFEELKMEKLNKRKNGEVKNGDGEGEGGGEFVATREPSDLAMNRLAWLVWEKKAAKINLKKAMSM